VWPEREPSRVTPSCTCAGGRSGLRCYHWRTVRAQLVATPVSAPAPAVPVVPSLTTPQGRASFLALSLCATAALALGMAPPPPPDPPPPSGQQDPEEHECDLCHEIVSHAAVTLSHEWLGGRGLVTFTECKDREACDRRRSARVLGR